MSPSLITRLVYFLSALGLLLLGSLPASAQSPTIPSHATIPLIANYDLDSTDLIYCSSIGQGGQVVSAPIPSTERVTTSGASSTTLEGVATQTGPGTPFVGIAVGDILYFNIDGTLYTRYVTAVASDISLTLDTAITIPAAGITFAWRDVSCSTAATAGWVPVSSFANWSFSVNVTQMNVTGGIVLSMECRPRGASNGGSPTSAAIRVADAVTITSATFPAGGHVFFSDDGLVMDECRVGVEIDSADDGGDLTTNAEQVSITFTGRRK